MGPRSGHHDISLGSSLSLGSILAQEGSRLLLPTPPWLLPACCIRFLLDSARASILTRWDLWLLCQLSGCCYIFAGNNCFQPLLVLGLLHDVELVLVHVRSTNLDELPWRQKETGTLKFRSMIWLRLLVSAIDGVQTLLTQSHSGALHTGCPAKIML